MPGGGGPERAGSERSCERSVLGPLSLRQLSPGTASPCTLHARPRWEASGTALKTRGREVVLPERGSGIGRKEWPLVLARVNRGLHCRTTCNYPRARNDAAMGIT